MSRKNRAQRDAARKSFAIMLGLALSGTAFFLWVNREGKTDPVKLPAPQLEQVIPSEPQSEPEPEPQPPVMPEEPKEPEPVTLGQPRIWTSLDGNRANAEFVTLEGNTLLLKKGTKNIQVPLDTFIEADQTYARRCAQAKSEAQQRIAQALQDKSITVHPDQPHIWSSQNGQTATATFSAIEDRTLVLEKKSKIIRIMLDELTEMDQLYALRCAQQLKREEQAIQDAPLQIFGRVNYQGKPIPIQPHLVYSGSGIPGELTRDISSLILKKGYQATLATTPNGNGLSKVLIAAKRDIRIPKLSKKLNDSIQFIRVLPWKNTLKKGHGGRNDLEALNQGWHYNWIGQKNPDNAPNTQFVPMVYSHRNTQDKGWIEDQISRMDITHILGFNEPDQLIHRKNEYLSVQKNSVQAMIPLMETGFRIGGPGCKEEGIWRWYPDFIKEAEEQMLRIDFIGLHWYDWGSNPSSNPDDSPGDIFNRFKNYIEKVYQQYKMPIWITEFNASRYRDEETQLKFLKLALPYLDSLHYVERYAWFQPVGVVDRTSGSGSFRETKEDASTPLTRIGTFWRDHPSVPSMDEEVYLGKNNLCRDEKEE